LKINISRSLYDNVDKDKLNKLTNSFANESENNFNAQNEKERKEFLEKLKNIRQTLIEDLISRKKLITKFSDKIQDERLFFYL
jgi:ClpP class serine protease